MACVGLLHTSPVHAPTFDTFVAEAAEGTDTVVVVDEVLLATARREGPEHPDVAARIITALDELERRGATVIVCTCSTIAGEAERLGRGRVAPVIRVDRPMAEAAVAYGPRIAIIAAVESTFGPTRALFESVANDAGQPINLSEHLCEGAWDRFEAGDHQGYLETIAATCSRLDGTCDVIVLAQASMAGATAMVDVSVPVVTSPRLAVEAAVRLA